MDKIGDILKTVLEKFEVGEEEANTEEKINLLIRKDIRYGIKFIRYGGNKVIVYVEEPALLYEINQKYKRRWLKNIRDDISSSVSEIDVKIG